MPTHGRARVANDQAAGGAESGGVGPQAGAACSDAAFRKDAGGVTALPVVEGAAELLQAVFQPAEAADRF